MFICHQPTGRIAHAQKLAKHMLCLLVALAPQMLSILLVTPGCVRVFVRSFVCSSVRVKNGNESRMRALPDELSPVTSEVHGHRSKYHMSVYKLREDASSFQRLQDLVSHFNTKVSCDIVL